jgi:hypothetical protein
LFGNIFGPVRDYPSMLNKIASFTFGVSIAGVVILRLQIPSIDKFLAILSVPIPIPIGSLSLPLGTILPALIFAFICRIIKLHNKLSDIFGIRKRFDINEVLIPLALIAGLQIDANQIEKLHDLRRQLMNKVFYKYISVDPGKVGIDRHYVTMAFDQWSWYWILLEVNFIAAIVGTILLLAGKSFTAALIFIIMLLIIWALQGIRVSCSRYTMQEVNQILIDKKRKQEVVEVFNAL